jgi:hypothetical protein
MFWIFTPILNLQRGSSVCQRWGFEYCFEMISFFLSLFLAFFLFFLSFLVWPLLPTPCMWGGGGLPLHQITLNDTQYDSGRRIIRPLQRPHLTTQEPDSRACGGTRTRKPSKRVAADVRHRTRDHWNRLWGNRDKSSHQSRYEPRSSQC